MTAPDVCLVPFDAFVDALRACLGNRAPSVTGKLFVAQALRLLEREDGWVRLEETWQDGDDRDIYRLFAGMLPLAGTVYILSDDAYRDGSGAIKTTSGCLERVVADYQKRTGVYLFEFDVFILGVDQCRLWVFHHEAVIKTFDLHTLR